MPRTYGEVIKSAEFKLTGNGDRCIGLLMESFTDMDPSMEADTYGTGGIINDFEREVAQLLDKESAVFMPSGTMAQQIALRIWSDSKDIRKVAYHPLCHLEIHEKDGLKVLHHLEPVLLGESSRLFTIEDLKGVTEPLSCLLIELPQREIGGQLPSWEELVKISEYCKSQGIKLHMDGARLFECLPYYNRPISEICSLFDSVYVSFYKGLGGIAGAMLAGSTDFIEESKVWKRRHGGDLISLYPYIINAKDCMKRRMEKMNQYWQHALFVSERLKRIEGVEILPKIPVCNMFHAFFPVSKEKLEEILINIAEKHNVALLRSFREIETSLCKAELSFGDSFEVIPMDTLNEALDLLELQINKAKLT